jgi:hypothetical protein
VHRIYAATLSLLCSFQLAHKRKRIEYGKHSKSLSRTAQTRQRQNKDLKPGLFFELIRRGNFSPYFRRELSVGDGTAYGVRS